MGVSVIQWRANVGMFNINCKCKRSSGVSHPNGDLEHENVQTCIAILVHTFRTLLGLLIIFGYSLMFICVFTLSIVSYTILSLLHGSIFDFNYSKFFSEIFGMTVYFPYLIFNLHRNIYAVCSSCSKKVKNLLFYVVVLQLLLIISGTVEINPGPKPSGKSNLSFAVWNLDSLPARDFARIPLIETFQSIYDFDIFGVCESMLRDDIPNDDIFIRGFSADPIRADKQANVRNGGVCLYYRESLPIKERRDLQIVAETNVAKGILLFFPIVTPTDQLQKLKST